jgi:hypothetical protein
MKITRRHFVASFGLASGGLLLTSVGCHLAKLPVRSPSVGTRAAAGPIDRSIDDTLQIEPTGDQFNWPHTVIRDGQSPTGQKIAYPTIHNVIVVGGGMAGMVTAWELRDLNPLVLEQAQRLGGNSKGESWRGTDYSIGAAYITKPDDNGEIDRFLKEIDAYRILRPTNESAPVAVDGTTVSSFWDNYQDAEVRDIAKRLKQYFLDVYNEKSGKIFPEIPFGDARMRSVVHGLDQQSFYDHIAHVIGEAPPPEIYNLIEHYCWSSFGASSHELSAAAGVNFYAAEFDSVFVGAGGNAAIIECIFNRMQPEQFKTNHLVYNIQPEKDHVVVRAVAHDGLIHEYSARSVVVATPKFVAARIIPGLEEKRLAAIQSLQYRGYLVANVLLNGKSGNDFYDMYFSSGRKASTSPMEAAGQQNVTDVILANFSDRDGTDTVLSLYRAYPFDGGRGMLYGMNKSSDIRPPFEKQIREEILPLLHLSNLEVHDIRFTRWGHAMPVAVKGIYSKSIPETLRAPFQKRVFFAEQDNWALPCFETASTEGFAAARDVRKLLRT